MKLKIGRHEYDISMEDEFLDNASCVQLLTQSKEKYIWGSQPDPVLSKRAIKEISKYTRIQKEHNYGDGDQVFSLDFPKEK